MRNLINLVRHNIKSMEVRTKEDIKKAKMIMTKKKNLESIVVVPLIFEGE